jgi:two-component sensor histidine kinase
MGHDEIVTFMIFAISSGIIVWVAALANSSLSKLRLAMEELAHRSKNAATVIESIVKQSLPEDPEIAKTIIGRIRAITSANDLIAASADMNVELNQLLAAKLSSFDRVQIRGPTVPLSSNMARNISLIVHELRTNALKYGALSVPNGQVRLSWSTENGSLILRWHENGGPLTVAPQRNGFGTKLILALATSYARKLVTA